MFGLPGFRKKERCGFALYAAAVRAARDPLIFTRLGVPDTLDGRFDMVGIYAFLVIRRLQAMGAAGQAAAQAVFDAMFSDMDGALRELGVSDLAVGKRVRAMWEAFHGRCLAYGAALGTPGTVAGATATDRAALQAALQRNVWRGRDGGDMDAIVALVLAQDAVLQAQPDADLLSGSVRFLSAAEALCQTVN